MSSAVCPLDAHGCCCRSASQQGYGLFCCLSREPYFLPSAPSTAYAGCLTGVREAGDRVKAVERILSEPETSFFSLQALGSRPKPCLASSLPSSVTPSPTCSSAVAAVGSDRALHVLVMCPGSPWFASSSSSSRASSFPHAASGWDCCRADWGGRSAVARGFAACAQEVRETPGTGGRPRDGALLSAEEDRSLARDSQGEAVDGEKELIRQAPGCCWTAPKPKEKEKREKANSCQVTQVARLLLLPEEVEKECGDVIGVAMDSFADDGR